ncbi:hypothetical protein NEOLEDRAFT_529544 [Neolentinus lepideus HHB14362 ss-1]|uniref:Uncharacterized protein n=1 Tax=Neolentinus lepideus HHB14362 ss-1 TaxID=1314782 RepID=A0A165RF03_9AGAM|nr:hypothetical protein NEOLEDRAFT_529544 [Neolentinus lepideus HHB14362 ss-1]
MEVKWTSIDVVRIGNAGESFAPRRPLDWRDARISIWRCRRRCGLQVPRASCRTRSRRRRCRDPRVSRCWGVVVSFLPFCELAFVMYLNFCDVLDLSRRNDNMTLCVLTYVRWIEA